MSASEMLFFTFCWLRGKTHWWVRSLSHCSRKTTTEAHKRWPWFLRFWADSLKLGFFWKVSPEFWISSSIAFLTGYFSQLPRLESPLGPVLSMDTASPIRISLESGILPFESLSSAQQPCLSSFYWHGIAEELSKIITEALLCPQKFLLNWSLI